MPATRLWAGAAVHARALTCLAVKGAFGAADAINAEQLRRFPLGGLTTC